MDGILNLWKPPGITSHDAVAAARRLLHERRIGHAGTLDPMAEGVLVLGIGQGARLLEYLVGGSKEYLACIRLGIATDTDDAQGRVLAATEVKRFRRRTIEEALHSFTGVQAQLPPIYSALKTAGQPAYRLARAGQQVQRTARQVEIESIRLVRWQRPYVTCYVTCSKGTYIRSLARDLGQHLGCGAHLCSLIRTRSGTFTVADAVPLALLKLAAVQGFAGQLLLPLEAALPDHHAITLDADGELCVRQGKDIVLPHDSPEDSGLQPWLAYNSAGHLLALLVSAGQSGVWHGQKVFPAQQADNRPAATPSTAVESSDPPIDSRHYGADLQPE